uniref:WD repeat-containing protein 76 n=1 Tax=Melopsittacus undulatus TaxID=13146 RepID=A0A8C6J2U1_MELUD
MALPQPGPPQPPEPSPRSRQRPQVREGGGGTAERGREPSGAGAARTQRRRRGRPAKPRPEAAGTGAGGGVPGLRIPQSPGSHPQEPPPTGSAELPVRQLRVLLTPLPVGDRRLLPQQRLPSAHGGAAPGKRRCRERSPRKAALGSGSGPDGSGWDEESDGSDAGDTPMVSLSAYERKRLKNITENAKFFAALKLHEEYLNCVTLECSHCCRAKPKKAEDETVLRRSMRLQRVDPTGIPVPEPPAQPEAEEAVRWGRVGHRRGIKPVLMKLVILVIADLNSMVLSEDSIKKVVKYRVCSIAIHPSESIILVAAGDKGGQIGLWNSCGAEGSQTFTAHNGQISCMQFSPFNPAHLLSVSSESLRCADVTRAVFDEVNNVSLSSFDFLDDNASTAIVGCWEGDVSVVDRRTPGTSPELSANIGFIRTRTVHVHPVNKQYFLAAGSTDVCVYDVRCLTAKQNEPVSSLKGHTKSVASAYFSPVTGSRVVTVCADNNLRDVLSSLFSWFLLCSHNNNTGRWLSRFRAIWDPKQEHCFVVGSMARPRQIEVFQDTGQLLHSFSNLDCLGSVCSINIVHPSRNILVGGNSSGRLHVFKE